MGTKMGTSYACIFMGFLEHKLELSCRGTFPLYYGRYIDDCLIISSLSQPELLDLVSFANTLHPTITLTHELSSVEVSFLDIRIKLFDGVLSTSVFYKPTDSHSYLHYSSCHSPSTKNSIPYSQFLRLRRLCSDSDDLESQAHLMCFLSS